MTINFNNIQFYNSLSRKKESLNIQQNEQIKMYVCGPTVYNRIHIGNARSIVVYDVLYRFLKYINNENVLYVRNITDVDDKIIKEAEKLNIPEKILSERMIEYFEQDCVYLNCLKPNVEPKVTNEINVIIELIEKILQNGFGYIQDGNVMFSVNKYADYGKLSGRSLKNNITGDKNHNINYKENADDFVLWKKTTEGITWNSPWGNGRPGWHIECSAMSYKYLGENFHIHGGGVDLKFPHHENEIAQSCCANLKSNFAQHWIHNGFLMAEGNKMSKSLNNFITVNDIEKRNISGLVLRLALMSGDYKKPLNYTEKLLSDSQKTIDKINKFVFKHTDDYKKVKTQINQSSLDILSDDMNLPKYLANIFTLLKEEKLEELIFALNLIGLIK